MNDYKNKVEKVKIERIFSLFFLIFTVYRPFREHKKTFPRSNIPIFGALQLLLVLLVNQLFSYRSFNIVILLCIRVYKYRYMRTNIFAFECFAWPWQRASLLVRLKVDKTQFV